MTEIKTIFDGNHCKITYDGALYRAFIRDKEIVSNESRDFVVERLQSEFSDFFDEASEDYSELNELEFDEEE